MTGEDEGGKAREEAAPMETGRAERGGEGGGRAGSGREGGSGAIAGEGGAVALVREGIGGLVRGALDDPALSRGIRTSPRSSSASKPSSPPPPAVSSMSSPEPLIPGANEGPPRVDPNASAKFDS